MKLFKTTILCAAVAFLMTGCGVYNPTTVHISLIHERGEVQVEGAVLPTGNKNVPVDIRASAAWGITNHLAVQGSVDPFRNYSQAMAGCFFPLEKNFVWELYGGIGFGRGQASNFGGVEPWTVPSGTYRQIFLQADAGWLEMTHKGHLDLAFSFKTGLLSGEIKKGRAYIAENSETKIDYTYTQAQNILLEPTAELRFGWERFKFNIKAGFTFLVPVEPVGYTINYFPISLGAGMSYRF